ncbi:HLA class II region expressed protein KE2 [Perkinsela sp. CCAP 1560/4]|nr:HLA class II region expressed protein KE2 [Perkinsela sp. CCAP 1560/4]|eukprot:KNH04759.1 HLA class II region expressed protein KE2 [Perkinsela sp. CCAP 1560/4]
MPGIPNNKAIYESLRAVQEQKGKFNQQNVQISSQINENELVLKQLKEVEEGDIVYKLTGPVLVSQEVDDGKRVVERRLHFLRGEQSKNTEKLSEISEKEGKLLKALEESQKSK